MKMCIWSNLLVLGFVWECVLKKKICAFKPNRNFWSVWDYDFENENFKIVKKSAISIS
jgi:hypothetical protein